jgi:ureidoacrylate peracid hydrolase
MAGPKDFAASYVTAQTLDAELADWMKAIAPFCWRAVEPVQPGRVALLVVDMNRPFVDDGRPLSSPNARAVLPRIRELVEAFRAANRPVLWIVQGHHSVAHDRGGRLASWWPSPIMEGTTDVELAQGLAARGDEKIILKRRYSGFYQTDLELTLRCLGIEQVVICGVLSHVCPLFTAADAFSRDLCVFYPPDATASLNRELHLSALRIVAGWLGHVTPARQIIAALASAKC